MYELNSWWVQSDSSASVLSLVCSQFLNFFPNRGPWVSVSPSNGFICIVS